MQNIYCIILKQGENIMKIKGMYNSAEIYTDNIEDSAIDQIKTMCDYEPLKDSKIRIMPDVHAGAGCTIGTTMTIKDKVVPNMVGVDIGCGMELVQIKEREIDFKLLDNHIKRNVPSGKKVRKTPHPYIEQINLDDLKCKEHLDLERAKLSIGSLGGGNHFIEVDKDDEGNLYIVIHSGSRHLGKEVAEYYQEEAYRRLRDKIDNKISNFIEELKNTGKTNLISESIKKMRGEYNELSKDLAYVENELFDDYINDMKIVQKFAVYNRQAMMDVILTGMKFTVVDGFTCIHNYIDTDNMILRKGAVSAQKGEKILIPINMRDGSLICVGKGNPDWNYSAPHGAGRLMSRRNAIKQFTVKQFMDEMKGIYSSSISINTLDESPMAYKRIDDIVANIEPTAEITKRIVPVYNFKASE